jgi:hypothetical protein
VARRNTEGQVMVLYLVLRWIEDDCPRLPGNCISCGSAAASDTASWAHPSRRRVEFAWSVGQSVSNSSACHDPATQGRYEERHEERHHQRLGRRRCAVGGRDRVVGTSESNGRRRA